MSILPLFLNSDPGQLLQLTKLYNVPLPFSIQTYLLRHLLVAMLQFLQGSIEQAGISRGTWVTRSREGSSGEKTPTSEGKEMEERGRDGKEGGKGDGGERERDGGRERKRRREGGKEG